MKKVLLPIALCLSMLASASVPQTITYQAVVRNSVHKLVRAKAVGVRISILKGSETGSVVYTESRKATTNINGLLTFAIGDEEAVTGDDLSKINWGEDVYFIKCEMDPNGGTSYSLESTSQLMSVPYAIYAERISKDATPAWTQTPEKPVYSYSEIEGVPELKDITEQDPEYKKSVAAGISAKDTARWNKKMDSFSETDPTFAKSAASAITQADIDKWNNKLGEFTESDPEFAKSVAAGITKNDTIRWNQALKMPASVITNVDIQNWNSKLDGYTETDPTFAKSIASTITKEDIDNWNSKMSSYSESDPEYKKSVAAGITAVDTARWNKVEKLGNQPANNITNVDINNWNSKLDSYTETDPTFAQSVAAGITKADTARWNKLEKSVANTITETQVNNWNNKLEAETDPEFAKSAAAGITTADITAWNNKLSGFTEADPAFAQSVAAGISKADTARWNKLEKNVANNITNADIQNWNNKLDSYTETDPAFAKSAAAGITTTDIANWNAKMDAYTETDPTFAASVAAGITKADTANWNKLKSLNISKTDVQNWNNKLTSSYTETDPEFSASVASGITKADTANWNKVLKIEKQPASAITTTDITNWNNKLDSYTETDPAFTASVAAGITKADTASWNKVLKIEKQPASAITTTDITNWNNKLDSYTETDPEYSKSLAAKINAKDTTRWGRFSKSPAATITETDIAYWNDIINQIPENVSSFTNDAKYVTESKLNLSNNTMYNMMLSMEKYYEDSLMAVSKNYVDSIRTVQQGEMTTYQQSVTNQFNTVNNKVTNMPASGITATDITNWNGKLSAETDPEFKKSAAAGITATDIENWNAKLGSYTETDPEFAKSEAAKIKSTDVANWNAKLSAESDPEFKKSAAAGITATDVENWNAKLDSYTETDPEYKASVAANIKAADTLRWSKKLSAETDPEFKRSVAGGITSGDIVSWNSKLSSETDPKFTASAAAGITATDVENWNAKLDSYTETDPEFAKSEAAKIKSTDVANWNAKLSAESDPEFKKSAAAGIKSTDVANWNAKLSTETDPEYKASVAANIKAADTLRWGKKLGPNDIADWAKASDKPTYNYNEIVDAPAPVTVPTKVSAFDNDAKYITEADFDVKLKEISDLVKKYQNTVDSLNSVIAAIKENQGTGGNSESGNVSNAVEGKLSGLFSVSNTLKIRFSQGNVQYNPSTGAMRFSDTQYSVIGNDNYKFYEDGFNGWCDLVNFKQYRIARITPIENAGNKPNLWRMLTPKEYSFLYTQRTNAQKLRTKADVNNVSGLVLLPDNWTTPTGCTMVMDAKDFTTNVYTLSQWSVLEKAGAVFLPAAGIGGKGSVTSVGSVGYYWLDEETTNSANVTDYKYAACLNFDNQDVKTDRQTITSSNAYTGFAESTGLLSLRLIQEEHLYKVSVETNNSEMGDVSISNTDYLLSGTSVKITATPNENSEFVSWSDGNTAKERSIVISKDSALTAIFKWKKYSLTILNEYNNRGSFSGAGSYDYGTEVIVKAVPNSCYSFTGWSDGNTSKERIIKITEDIILSGSFVQESYNLSLSATEGGSVAGAGKYYLSTSATMIATPNHDYEFVKWSDGDVNPTRTIKVVEDSVNYHLCAVFKLKNADYYFTVSSNKKVYISSGNLQYQPSSKTWRFALVPFENIKDLSSVSSSYEGWLDDFGWATSGYYHSPILRTYTVSDYLPNGYDISGKYDWGYNPISNGGNEEGIWRTLSLSEWSYLLGSRLASLRIKAKIEGISGLILLPDNWIQPDGISISSDMNEFTIDEWCTLEAVGAVFLPSEHYWTTKYWNSSESYYIKISEVGNYSSSHKPKYQRCSVRLVKDVN